MTKLVEPINGKLYGITYSGGSNYSGVVFEYDYINSVYSVKFNFDYDAGKPYQNIVELEDGILYGATTCCSNYGRIFSYNVNTEELSFVCDFDINTGSWPTGEFFRCSNSEIISVSTGWAAYGKGALLVFDPETSLVTKINDFSGNSDQGIQGTPIYKDENIYVLSDNLDENFNYSTLLLIGDNQENSNVVVDAFHNVSGSLSVYDNKLFYFSNMSDQDRIRVFNIDLGKVVDTPYGLGTGHMTLADNGKLYGMRIPWGSNPFKIFEFDPVSFSSGIEPINPKRLAIF